MSTLSLLLISLAIGFLHDVTCIGDSNRKQSHGGRGFQNDQYDDNYQQFAPGGKNTRNRNGMQSNGEQDFQDDQYEDNPQEFDHGERDFQDEQYEDDNPQGFAPGGKNTRNRNGKQSNGEQDFQDDEYDDNPQEFDSDRRQSHGERDFQDDQYDDDNSQPFEETTNKQPKKGGNEKVSRAEHFSCSRQNYVSICGQQCDKMNGYKSECYPVERMNGIVIRVSTCVCLRYPEQNRTNKKNKKKNNKKKNNKKKNNKKKNNKKKTNKKKNNNRRNNTRNSKI